MRNDDGFGSIVVIWCDPELHAYEFVCTNYVQALIVGAVRLNEVNVL